MCGTLGDLGCFSFQNSNTSRPAKAALIPAIAMSCWTGAMPSTTAAVRPAPSTGKGCFTRGSNYRMQHFQAAMLLQQIEKLVKETEIRRANADYLGENLKQIPGITPARLPADSRAVWHLYPLRYDATQFSGLLRTN